MLSRWNIPRPGDEEWGWGPGEVRAVSLYVAQHPENDISQPVADAQGVTIYPTIEAALTLGTGSVAVDGVALIAEHGDFPDDERGSSNPFPRASSIPSLRISASIVFTIRSIEPRFKLSPTINKSTRLSAF